MLCYDVTLVIIKLVWRERLRDYGLKITGWYRKSWVYLLGLGVVLPLVFIFGRTASFQHTYPFYHLAVDEPLWPRFFIWELLYALQFVSLEFYFRGFLIHGTKRHCGPYSVFLMTIPYCMIHFGKPMPEALGAIGAGVILGFLSLKTRSVWMGAAIHIGVAWTMDTLAILHMHGKLPMA